MPEYKAMKVLLEDIFISGLRDLSGEKIYLIDSPNTRYWNSAESWNLTGIEPWSPESQDFQNPMPLLCRSGIPALYSLLSLDLLVFLSVIGIL